jgi:adenine-specific DNA-methyltransferase
MRYLGNKESITPEIIQLLFQKGLLDEKMVFFDAFCGMGSVSNAVKEYHDIVFNDALNCCYTYTYGKLVSGDCAFLELGFDPFEYFNSSKEIQKGFFYKNYSPSESERMYFSVENAGRIDFFRSKIEEWKNSSKISEIEYIYLLACLLESISDVANVAGVYGAFLKHWDVRATKSIQFKKISVFTNKHNAINGNKSKIEDIISYIQCDIIYLDPPYTQNQYGTQYHLLETLLLNDNPSISKITGSRSTAPMRSDWSKEYESHILFDKIVSQTKAKHIVFSYNNDGFLSKNFIEAVLKRYGKTETYECKTISYKKYNNFKTSDTKEHFEYLFYVEKKDEKEIIYESPLNYIGSKSKLIPTIKKNLPHSFNKVIDAFGGGFNVGANIPVSQIVYNDINHFVVQLIKSFNSTDTYQYIQIVKKNVSKYGLSPANKEAYVELRNYYNSLPQNERDPQLLYTLILYGFQQQIRFNGSYGYNNPVGMRWFNDNILEKLISFSQHIKEKNVQYVNMPFEKLLPMVDKDTFVYLDPPYRHTLGSYNDGRRGFEGWTIDHEKSLCNFANNINDLDGNFMLSYVVEFNGVKNKEILSWVSQNNYKMQTVEECQGHYNDRKEVLITNY